MKFNNVVYYETLFGACLTGSLYLLYFHLFPSAMMTPAFASLEFCVGLYLQAKGIWFKHFLWSSYLRIYLSTQEISFTSAYYWAILYLLI
jgi:hypothetical protein